MAEAYGTREIAAQAFYEALRKQLEGTKAQGTEEEYRYTVDGVLNAFDIQLGGGEYITGVRKINEQNDIFSLDSKLISNLGLDSLDTEELAIELEEELKISSGDLQFDGDASRPINTVLDVLVKAYESKYERTAEIPS